MSSRPVAAASAYLQTPRIGVALHPSGPTGRPAPVTTAVPFIVVVTALARGRSPSRECRFVAGVRARVKRGPVGWRALARRAVDRTDKTRKSTGTSRLSGFTL
jgi:hypothetical protein